MRTRHNVTYARHVQRAISFWQGWKTARTIGPCGSFSSAWRRNALTDAITEAHKRGLKVTGHLCSVTYDEAIELGIDNLEYGFSANTALDPDKKPDTCSTSAGNYTLMQMSPGSPEADRLIAALIAPHVAITSTLPGSAATVAREASDTGPPLRPEVWQAMSPSARQAYVLEELPYVSALGNQEHNPVAFGSMVALQQKARGTVWLSVS